MNCLSRCPRERVGLISRAEERRKAARLHSALFHLGEYVKNIDAFVGLGGIAQSGLAAGITTAGFLRG